MDAVEKRRITDKGSLRAVSLGPVDRHIKELCGHGFGCGRIRLCIKRSMGAMLLWVLERHRSRLKECASELTRLWVCPSFVKYRVGMLKLIAVKTDPS